MTDLSQQQSLMILTSGRLHSATSGNCYLRLTSRIIDPPSKPVGDTACTFRVAEMSAQACDSQERVNRRRTQHKVCPILWNLSGWYAIRSSPSVSFQASVSERPQAACRRIKHRSNTFPFASSDPARLVAGHTGSPAAITNREIR